ncbi:MAG: hypothetical protein J0L61_08610 [Planctomycetes bacterium]|nr:hypothetical protein [Planctomycetota bacterium]
MLCAVPVPEFAGWVCYDHHARRWLTRERLQSLATSYAERQAAPASDQELMESFVHSADWADWEFLQAPEDVGEGIVHKHDLRRIEALLAAEWDVHQRRVRRRR